MCILKFSQRIGDFHDVSASLAAFDRITNPNFNWESNTNTVVEYLDLHKPIKAQTHCTQLGTRWRYKANESFAHSSMKYFFPFRQYKR